MSKLRFVLILAGLAMLMPAAAFAATGDAGTGLVGTAHDFTSKGVGLCTFCHTPHKGLSTLLLWNHTLSTNTFSWAPVTATTAGTKFPTFKGDTYNGSTAKCLSCHDGSVAIGDIAWFKEGKPSNLDNEKHGKGDTFNVGFGGDMTGNHPVAMPYPFQNVANTYNTVKTGSGAVLTEWRADPTTLNIRLFNDADGTGTNISAGPVAGKTGIECSSCHDPHNGKTVVEDLFLRGLLTGNDTSYICLKCHDK